MNYPAEILPDPGYKTIDCNLSDHFLIRHATLDEGDELLDQETGNIKVKYICSPREQISDLSTSLLGTYNIGHINLSFTSIGEDKYMHYCPPDERVDIPAFETDFTNEGHRTFWCAPISMLHNQPFDYSKSADPVIATCKVTHTPMRWNFWHFSLRWQLDTSMLEDLEPKQKRKIAQRLGFAARVTISRLAKAGIPEFPKLPQACYSKS